MAERPHLVTREACHSFFRTVLAKPSSSPWCANDDVAMVNQLFRAMQKLPHDINGRPTRETYELVQQVWLMSSPSASMQNPDTWLHRLQSLWCVYQTNTVENGDDHDTDKSFWSQQQQEALWAPRRSTYPYTLKGLLQCNCDQKRHVQPVAGRHGGVVLTKWSTVPKPYPPSLRTFCVPTKYCTYNSRLSAKRERE
jgi:hypothetical protein